MTAVPRMTCRAARGQAPALVRRDRMVAMAGVVATRLVPANNW